jgi:hypothetical protein
MPDHDPLAEPTFDVDGYEKPVTTPMAVYLVAGPRMTIMPGLEAIPCSEVELAAIERQAAAEAVAAERARIRAAMEAYFSSDEPPVVSTEADVLAIIEGGDDA